MSYYGDDLQFVENTTTGKEINRFLFLDKFIPLSFNINYTPDTSKLEFFRPSFIERAVRFYNEDKVPNFKLELSKYENINGYNYIYVIHKLHKTTEEIIDNLMIKVSEDGSKVEREIIPKFVKDDISESDPIQAINKYIGMRLDGSTLLTTLRTFKSQNIIFYDFPAYELGFGYLVNDFYLDIFLDVKYNNNTITSVSIKDKWETKYVLEKILSIPLSIPCINKIENFNKIPVADKYAKENARVVDPITLNKLTLNNKLVAIGKQCYDRCDANGILKLLQLGKTEDPFTREQIHPKIIKFIKSKHNCPT